MNVACKGREVDKSMESIIKSRGDDPWAIAVNGRLQYVNDLRAEDAIYHDKCDSNFRIMKSIPKKYSGEILPVPKKRGRTADSAKEAAYIPK